MSGVCPHRSGELVADVSCLSGDVSCLSGDVSCLSGDVSGEYISGRGGELDESAVHSMLS